MEKYAQQRIRMAEAKALATGAIEPAPVRSGIDARRANMTPMEREAADKREQNEMIKFFILMMVGISGIMLLIALAGWMIAVSLREGWQAPTDIGPAHTNNFLYQWYAFQEGQDPLSLWLGQFYHGASEKVVLVAHNADCSSFPQPLTGFREQAWEKVAQASGWAKEGAQALRKKTEL